MSAFRVGTAPCCCQLRGHAPKLIAVTGGPGAGKTAVLEMASRSFCRHIAILPESAGIVFGGGFPRAGTPSAKRAAQRAIYHVQTQLEELLDDEGEIAIGLCDRGTVDGVAYWPDTPASYWAELGTTPQQELGRYAAVIHLRTPSRGGGYGHDNPLRIEDAELAAAIDERIFEAWRAHPRRLVIPNEAAFLVKARGALEQLRAELPACCHTHDLDVG